MSTTTHTLLVTLLVLSASVWFGGLVAIAVVARAAVASLEPGARVAFFRALGRGYLGVGAVALALALVSGLALVAPRGWDATAVAAAVVAAALVVVLVVAVGQARRMSKLRERAIAAPDDAKLAAAVRAGGLAANSLRGVLGLLSLALMLLGCVLAA